MFTEKQVSELDAKLDARHVAERSKGNFSLSYIEGWHAIAEANRIFGFDGWNRQTMQLRQLGDAEKNAKGNWVVSYMAQVCITVNADGQEIVRDGSGFGSGFDRDVGQAHESALKEAETDAMKRALMTFGNPFGLALYDKSKANVGKPGEAWPEGKGKSQNNTAMREMCREMNACTTVDEVDKVLVKYKEDVDLCRTLLPDKWHGGGDHPGTLSEVKRVKASLKEQA